MLQSLPENIITDKIFEIVLKHKLLYICSSYIKTQDQNYV